MGEPEELEVIHFSWLRPGDDELKPSRVLRRFIAGGVQTDEVLGRADGQWHATTLLAAAERGELPGEVRKLHPVLAQSDIDLMRLDGRVAVRAVARQATGEFALRLAVNATVADHRELDATRCAEYVSFLTGAPVVGEGPEGSYRTDGMWVWPDALADAVQAENRPPAGTLDDHIRSRQFLLPTAIAAAVIARARALLMVAATLDDRSEPVRESAVPGAPSFPTRSERSVALRQWHAEWTDRHTGSTPFRPEQNRDLEDYNLHYVDLEASAEVQREFDARARAIMGLDPETGRDVDI